MSSILERLSEQQHFANALLEILEKETSAVAEGDVDQLNGLVRQKTQRCAELDGLGREMQRWLAGKSLDSWLEDQDEPVRTQWQQLSDTLRRCQRTNDANGLLIERRQTEIEGLLKPRGGTTYGATGQNEAQSDASLTFRA